MALPSRAPQGIRIPQTWASGKKLLSHRIIGASEPFEHSLGAVDFKRRVRSRQIVVLQNEVARALCVVTSENGHQFAIDWNIADRVLGLYVEVFGRRDPNRVLVPQKRLPFQAIDLDTARPGAQGEQKHQKRVWILFGELGPRFGRQRYGINLRAVTQSLATENGVARLNQFTSFAKSTPPWLTARMDFRRQRISCATPISRLPNVL
jgi:hypothetical protein